MRDTPRPRRSVRPLTLRLLKPLFRYSIARDAYVLRIGGGQYGPVLVAAKTEPAVAVELAEPRSQPTGRFARTEDAHAEAPMTKTRQG